MLGPSRADLLSPSRPPGLAGMCHSGSGTPPLVSSRPWLRPTPSRPTCGASSDGQSSAGDGAEWLGVSRAVSSSPTLSSILQWWKRVLTNCWGCGRDQGSYPHTRGCMCSRRWGLTRTAAAGASQPPPSLPSTPQPPESSCCAVSWTMLPHVAPLKPSRMSRAPSKAVTCSLQYAPSPSVFPLRSRKLLGFPQRGGEGCPGGLHPHGLRVAALFITAAGASAARQLLICFICAVGFPQPTFFLFVLIKMSRCTRADAAEKAE